MITNLSLKVEELINQRLNRKTYMFVIRQTAFLLFIKIKIEVNPFIWMTYKVITIQLIYWQSSIIFIKYCVLLDHGTNIIMLLYNIKTGYRYYYRRKISIFPSRLYGNDFFAHRTQRTFLKMYGDIYNSRYFSKLALFLLSSRDFRTLCTVNESSKIFPC